MLGEIRRRLSLDRGWSVYPLGDLAPDLFPKTVWYCNSGGSALVMQFQGFEPPILFTLGEAGQVAPLFEEMAANHPLSLHIRSDILPLIEDWFQVV